ncbi:MAG: MmgE/PrpD family protein, partial [Gaiellaceae bacterium]
MAAVASAHVQSATGEQSDVHEAALLDWLACAGGGWEHSATRAARMLTGGEIDRVVALGTAGHVLDFDDTFRPGVAHLSAPTAPVALTLGAQLDRSVKDVVDAYAVGFEAMGALSRGCGAALY